MAEQSSLPVDQPQSIDEEQLSSSVGHPATMFEFEIDRAKVAKLLIGITAVLAFLSTTGHAIQLLLDLPPTAQISRIFNLGGETNVASWYSSALLFISAGLLAYLAHRDSASSRKRWFWLALVFVFLSMDETAVLHDVTLEQPLREWLQPSGFLAFPWVIVGWAFVVLMTAAFGRFVLNLPTKVRALLITSAFVYISGALVLEMISAWLYDVHIDQLIIRGLVSTAQELAEIGGIIIFIYGLLLHISNLRGGHAVGKSDG